VGREITPDREDFQVRDVNGVASPPQRLGELTDAGRESLRVMKQHHFGHLAPSRCGTPGSSLPTSVTQMPGILARWGRPVKAQEAYPGGGSASVPSPMVQGWHR
jgi:hypothetical protein